MGLIIDCIKSYHMLLNIYVKRNKRFLISTVVFGGCLLVSCKWVDESERVTGGPRVPHFFFKSCRILIESGRKEKGRKETRKRRVVQSKHLASRLVIFYLE